MDWLNNPWVTGIGGGIISGLLVFGITQRIFTNRNAAEYRQKVDATNREVIYALRPGIPEGVVPARDVVEAIVNATARKYAVNSTDVYGCRKIGEELMKEVMDSSFISARQKAEYCEALRTLIELTPFPGSAMHLAVSEVLHVRERTDVTLMAATLSVLAGAMTAVVAALNTRHTQVFSRNFITALLLPTLITVVASSGGMAWYYLRSKAAIRHRRMASEAPDPGSPE